MTWPANDSLQWRIAFAATLAMSIGIGTFSLHAFSALSPLAVPALGISRTELGSLATVSFGVAAAASTRSGRGVDLLGGRILMYWVFALGGIAAAITAAAQSMPWLWASAAVAGIGLAAANPVTNQLIADHVPPGQRGLQMGVKQSGGGMLQIVIGFVLPSFAVVVGWRGAVLIGLLVALIGLVLVWTVIPSVPPLASRSAQIPRHPMDPAIRWLTAYGFAIAFAVTTTLVYAPLYSYERVGLSATAAGAGTGVLGGAGMVGRIVWARLADQRIAAHTALVAMAAMGLASVILILLSADGPSWLLWPGLLGFGLSAYSAQSVLMLAIVSIAKDGKTGRPSGLIGSGLFLGYMSGPIVFGASVDYTQSYAVGWLSISFMCFVAFAVAGIWAYSAFAHERP